LRRANEFIALGVPNLWILDPKERAGYIYSKSGLQLSHDNVLTTTDPVIKIDLNECFSALDET